MEKERPKVGVGVWIRKDGKLLLGKRKGTFGGGTWCVPGGHVEFFELLVDAAKREALEETGIKVNNIRFMCFTETMSTEFKAHYLTFIFVADSEQEPVLMEPDKCEEWKWFDWGALPKPLFNATRSFVETGINPLEM